MFYTAATVRGDNVLLRGYDNGRAFNRKVPYRPKLFMRLGPGESWTDADWRDIYGNPLYCREFDSIREAKDFIQEHESVIPIYGMDKFEYVYLNEVFGGHEVPYDRAQLRELTLDTEVHSEEGFPDIDKADKEVTAITLGEKGFYTCWGCGDFTGVLPPNSKYVRCSDEADLLVRFVDFWTQGCCPDIVTGWYIMFFDIPYLINRINNVLGEGTAKRLSPWGFFTERTTNIKGSIKKVFAIGGVQILDMLELYRKFTYSEKESYKLDFIAQEELGEGKLDYHEYATLHKLFALDYNKFITYNIRDSLLVDKIDKKTGLIDLALALAYDARVNYTDVFKQVPMWDSLIHNHLWQRHVATSPKGNSRKDEAYEGAYVKDPTPGMYEWIVSFDFTSMYPHLIMQYNISPEMLVQDEMYPMTVDDLLNSKFPNIPDGCCMAPNGHFFRRDKVGFLPEMMARLYESRTVYKNKMLEAEKEVERAQTDEARKVAEALVTRYKNAQLAKKVQLNAAYGALGNEFFRYFDVRQATAITIGGQLSVRWVEKFLNVYMNQIMETEGLDYILAADTDSVYVHMDALVKKCVPADKLGDKVYITDFLCDAAKRAIEPVISSINTDLVVKTHAPQDKMNMKREVVADRGIWTAKKRYMLNVWDSEGVRYAKPKLKIKGMEAVRSSTPALARRGIKAAYEIFMNGNQKDLLKFVEEFKADWAKASPESIAFPTGVSELDKHADREGFHKKGCPMHVRASLIYNKLLRDRGLAGKYELIKEGEKVKYVFLKTPNPTTGRENVIAFINVLPEEFELGDFIDRQAQLHRAFMAPLETVTDVIGWKAEQVVDMESFYG